MKFSSVVTLSGRTAGNVQDQVPDGNGGWKGQNYVSGTIGVDCSGFAASALMFDSPDKPGTKHLIPMSKSMDAGSMKLMDFIIKDGHVMLLAYKSGNSFTVYESHMFDPLDNQGNYDNGRAEISTYSLSVLLRDGYTFRTLFCTTCNKTGAYQITLSTHARTCSECDYVWIEEAHTYINGKCSVCGVSQ